MSYDAIHRSEEEIIEEMAEMGVQIVHPQSRNEKQMADAMEAFSSFVLEDEPEKCQHILEKHEGSSVGILQGGSEKHEIYRVLITDDENEAASELFEAFHSVCPGFRHIWSKTKLQEYMITMASAATPSAAGTKQLGNLMFILTFGETDGQVRHIDNMVSNQQICLYMSSECPSTIIYSLDEPSITNTNELLDHWENEFMTMNLTPFTENEPEIDLKFLKNLLHLNKDRQLKNKWYTKHCANWVTIDSNLKCFGKLYQPVLSPLSLTMEPGTVLLAGGNDVHSGPPTTKARMFAFAIGIPEDASEEENDGEVQYSPVLLHLDLCTILFPIMDLEYTGEHRDTKLFLVTLLVSLVKDYPTEPFDRLLGDDREEVRNWLIKVAGVLQANEEKNHNDLNCLVEEAVASETMMYSPDVAKRKAKKKKRRLKNNRR